MYTKEQQEKNNALVDKHLSKYSQQQRGSVKQELSNAWANDSEALELITERKKYFDLEASPEEVDEAFKNFHI